jgi:hypothetical protein
MAEPTILGALRDPQFRRDVRQGLTDALNRGFVGGLLGGPVDIATMMMRPFGYTTEKPVGGSEWIGQKMQDAGLVSAARNPLAEFLSAVAVPSAVTKAAPALMQAETRLAENLAAPTRFRDVTRGQGGAIVYHGTPHRFERFDASKIGTGEGAQAYGHGLYFAESPDVAKSYAQQLGDAQGVLEAVPASKFQRQIQEQIKRGVKESRGSNAGIPTIDDFKDWVSGIEGPHYNSDSSAPFKALERLAKRGGGGSNYTVEIPDEMIPKMLDWDKPISEQSQAIQDIAKSLGTDLKLPGRALYNQAQLKVELGEGPLAPAASEWFRSQGIPGIRYLDEGSRGTGKGTRNLVVFPGEESSLSILRRD